MQPLGEDVLQHGKPALQHRQVKARAEERHEAVIVLALIGELRQVLVFDIQMRLEAVVQPDHRHRVAVHAAVGLDV